LEEAFNIAAADSSSATQGSTQKHQIGRTGLEQLVSFSPVSTPLIKSEETSTIPNSDVPSPSHSSEASMSPSPRSYPQSEPEFDFIESIPLYENDNHKLNYPLSRPHHNKHNETDKLCDFLDSYPYGDGWDSPGSVMDDSDLLFPELV
jgi:hypothetical protein